MFEEYKLSKDAKTIQEWSNIYKIKTNDNSKRKISIYEYAYLIGSGNLNYRLLSDVDPEYKELSSEQAELNELMFLDVYNEIMQNADEIELDILKDKYVETDWVKLQLRKF